MFAMSFVIVGKQRMIDASCMLFWVMSVRGSVISNGCGCLFPSVGWESTSLCSTHDKTEHSLFLSRYDAPCLVQGLFFYVSLPRS